MDNNTLVSVIIPIYNGERHIRRTLDNLLKQTYPNYEAIIVLDGCTDGTYAICEEYKKKSEKIRIIQQQNAGTYIARYNGISNAKGDYIMFLDADDYLEENAIQLLVEVKEKYNSDLIKFRYEKLNNGEHQYFQYEYFPEEKTIEKDEFKTYIYPFFLEGYMMNSMVTGFIRKSCIPVNRIERKIVFGEDLIFNLNCMENLNRVTFINEPLYKYCTNINSVTKTQDNEKLITNLKDALYVYLQLYEYAIKWGFEGSDISKLKVRILYELSTIINRMELTKETEEKIRNILSDSKYQMIRKSINSSDIDETHLSQIICKI